ncbi:MAG: hypothetical protein WAM14_19405 [Candidatus Nitrosopolaris sp.]
MLLTKKSMANIKTIKAPKPDIGNTNASNNISKIDYLRGKVNMLQVEASQLR